MGKRRQHSDQELLVLIKQVFGNDHPSAQTLYDYSSPKPDWPLNTKVRSRVALHLRFCEDCASVVKDIELHEKSVGAQENSAGQCAPTEEERQRAETSWQRIKGRLRHSRPETYRSYRAERFAGLDGNDLDHYFNGSCCYASTNLSIIEVQLKRLPLDDQGKTELLDRLAKTQEGFKTMQQVFIDAFCVIHGIPLDPKWVNEK